MRSLSCLLSGNNSRLRGSLLFGCYTNKSSRRVKNTTNYCVWMFSRYYPTAFDCSLSSSFYIFIKHQRIRLQAEVLIPMVVQIDTCFFIDINMKMNIFLINDNFKLHRCLITCAQLNTILLLNISVILLQKI